MIAIMLAAAVAVAPIPRTADGKPNLSGFWQVMNTADLDIQAHQARKDAEAGLGVVEGNEIPYQPLGAGEEEKEL